MFFIVFKNIKTYIITKRHISSRLLGIGFPFTDLTGDGPKTIY